MNNLRDILEAASKSRDELYSVIGEVTAVNSLEGICDIEPLNGDAPIFGVRLFASPGSEHSGLTLIPKTGSIALVTFINKQTGYVALCSEIGSFKVDVGQSELELDQAGISVTKGSESLKAILSDLVSALQTLTVTCAAPGSPSSPPINTAQFTAITPRINTLLKA